MSTLLALSPLHHEPSLLAALPTGVRLESALNTEEALAQLSSSEIALLLVPSSIDLAASRLGMICTDASAIATPAESAGRAVRSANAAALRDRRPVGADNCPY